MNPIAVHAATLADHEGLRSADDRPAEAWAVGPSGRIRFPSAVSGALPGFRRFDTLSKVLVALCERIGLDRHLDPDQAQNTALVFASTTGCLDADRRFARGFSDPKGIEPALFPFTLPSTCLGNLAIRHGLQGPTLSVSLDGPDPGAAIEVTAELFVDGIDAALLAFGDWGESLGVPNRLALLLLAPVTEGSPGLITLDALRDDAWTVVSSALESA